MNDNTARPRHPASMRPACLWAFLPALVLALVMPSVGNTQMPVVTDITSSGLGTNVQPLSNGVYNIIGGTRPGGGPNLFHSFGDFSIGQGDIANFLNDSGLTTSNIIGRVTGGNISNIDGVIQTTGFGNANLFLVNPSGFVFGPQGSFDVGGSVSFSTAQYLRLSDGVDSANFYANPASDGLANSILVVDPVVKFGFLSSAAPTAYGFLTAPDPGATITVHGSDLFVPSGQSISLVGGKVIIQGDTRPDGTVQQPAHLSAPNGSIRLASAASPGEFSVDALQSLPNVDGVSGVLFTSFGSVSLLMGSSIDVHGTSTVWVKGGQLVVSVKDATLTTTSDSSADSDTISLSLGSAIVTSNSGAEAGADVQITVGTLNLDGSTIMTQTFGNGNGGNITANVGTLFLANGATMSSNNFSVGTDLNGDGVADVFGVGGNVTVQGLEVPGSAADSVTLSTGAQIIAETNGRGRGGDVNITADTVLMDSSEFRTVTFLGDGVGGDLFLNVRRLDLQTGSSIRSTNFNFGTDLNGDGVVDVTGVGGNIIIQGISHNEESFADSVVLSSVSQIVSETINGDGGGVAIAATSVNVTGQDIFGQVSSIKSSTNGTGGGGDIVLSVQRASVSDGATIASETRFDNGSGNPVAGESEGGNITVQGLDGDGSKADSLTLKAFPGGIVSGSNGSGRPGGIEVYANSVSLTEGAVIVAGSQQGDGTGGIVTIDAGSVAIVGGSRISSQARTLDAGRVTIVADQLTLDNGSIETTTISETGGRGGDVELTVGSLSLANGATINSSTSQTGRAGDITVTVGMLSLANGSSISSASTGTVPVTNFDGTTEPPGQAGNVTITATGGFTSDASSIATSAEANHGGDISITADSMQLSNGTVITANSKAPLEVTKLVLDQNGLPVEVKAVGDDGRSDGNAGNVTITSASNVVMQNSSVTTEASAASGGSIEIDASDAGMIQLVNSRVSTSVKGVKDVSDGGNITIDPQFVILQNSQILAQAVAGAGGNITIVSNVFLADPGSLVDASSQLGISGTVNILSPVQNIGGELTALTQEFSSAAALLAQQCAARAADGKFSTFVVAAHEGLPAEPGGFLASPSLTSELLGSRLSGRDSQSQLPAITVLFPKYDARPIQLARFGDSCHRQ